uniref:OTU domain-containing protein n=1 Tax=Timema cristinae TaxID=61476 RepID=A0A7R9CZC3_TIMCR|nr:unnamed protein product [Timema cristinae]
MHCSTYKTKIQALKKTINKADKKRKKEIAEEVTKLESELESRQNAELLQLKESNSQVDHTAVELDKLSTNENSVEKEEKTFPKAHAHIYSAVIGSPYKRVRRKLVGQLLRSKDLRIRTLWTEQSDIVTSISYGLRIRSLCQGLNLYSAVDHQRKMVGEVELGLSRLRLLTADYLRQNRDEFLPFISHPETGNMLTEEQYYEYCDQVAGTPAWGGEVEVSVEELGACISPYIMDILLASILRLRSIPYCRGRERTWYLPGDARAAIPPTPSPRAAVREKIKTEKSGGTCGRYQRRPPLTGVGPSVSGSSLPSTACLGLVKISDLPTLTATGVLTGDGSSVGGRSLRRYRTSENFRTSDPDSIQGLDGRRGLGTSTASRSLTGVGGSVRGVGSDGDRQSSPKVRGLDGCCHSATVGSGAYSRGSDRGGDFDGRRGGWRVRSLLDGLNRHSDMAQWSLMPPPPLGTMELGNYIDSYIFSDMEGLELDGSRGPAVG